ARSIIEVPSEDDNTIITSAFQEDEVDGLHTLTIDDDPIPNHPDGGMQGGDTTSAGGSSLSSVGLSGPVGDISLHGSSLPDVDAQGRRHCWLQDGQLMASYPVSATITSSFKRFLHPGAYTWKMVPPERRQTYREEFRNEWFWDPTLEDAIWAAWELRAPQRYRDMAKEKGVQPNDVAWELFRRLHDNADGSHTDGKSARIAADALARVEELSQPTPGTDEAPPPVDMSVVYVDAALQHSKKNRVFGLDSQSRSYSAPSVSSAAPPQPDTQAAIRALQEKMDA
ncbi:hypothetical protein C2S52_005181, partial [Perilla frutescens var. hirtella]